MYRLKEYPFEERRYSEGLGARVLPSKRERQRERESEFLRQFFTVTPAVPEAPIANVMQPPSYRFVLHAWNMRTGLVYESRVAWGAGSHVGGHGGKKEERGEGG